MIGDDKYTRPTLDQTFFDIIRAIGKRGTCNRGRSAALITRGGRILTTGFVGSTPGEPHCDDVGHLIRTVIYYNRAENGELVEESRSDHCMRTLHAELNAILQAAIEGISLVGATLYCTMVPCRYVCASAIVRVGIVEVKALRGYQRDSETRELFERCGIKLTVIDDRPMEYEK